MSKPIQTVEELDAVLHWRGKHAVAIKERDALQQRLTATDERADLLEGLLRNVRNKLSFGPEDTKAIDAALRVSAGDRCTGVPVAKLKPVAKLHAERLTGKDGEYGITVEDSQWFNTCRLTGGEFNLYAEQPAPVAVVPPEREPKDYAIEHAEYMAKSADGVLAKFQAYGLALLAVDEGGDDGEGELLENIDSTRSDLQEALVDLRGMVYEFRKRAAKSR